jgi:hypothetical protein
MKRVSEAVAKGAAIEKQLDESTSKATVEEFRQSVAAVLGKADLGYGAPSTPVDTDTRSLRHLSGKLRMVLYGLQSADAAPTQEQDAALASFEKSLAATEQEWNTLLKVDLPKLNEKLKATGAKEISQTASDPIADDEGDNDRDR